MPFERPDMWLLQVYFSLGLQPHRLSLIVSLKIIYFMEKGVAQLAWLLQPCPPRILSGLSNVMLIVFVLPQLSEILEVKVRSPNFIL